MSYLYTGPPLIPPKNGKARATLGAMIAGELALPVPGRFPMTPVRLPVYQPPATPAAPTTTPTTPVSTAIVKVGPDMQRPPWRSPGVLYMGPPATIEQVQTGMTQTPATSAPPDLTLCPINVSGARVCAQVPSSVQTGATPARTSPAIPGWQPTSCVNVDPTSGACLDSSILAAQNAGLATPATPTAVASASCVNVDPNTGACLDSMIGGFDLSTIPAWAWYVLFGGVVYWLFFKKRGR